MNKTEAIARLIEIMQHAGECAHHPLQRVAIKIKRARAPQGEHVYLAGRNSPKGNLLCRNSEGEWVVSFDAVDVTAWCVAQLKKLGVEVEITLQARRSEVD